MDDLNAELLRRIEFLESWKTELLVESEKNLRRAWAAEDKARLLEAQLEIQAGRHRQEISRLRAKLRVAA